MKRTFETLIVSSLCVLFLTVQSEAQIESSLEILSKSDAQLMFTLDKKTWNQNVLNAASLGMAKPIRGLDGVIQMGTKHADGIFMVVSPDYGENSGKPSFIQVGVMYTTAIANLMSGNTLLEIEKATVQQMQPEFDVMMTSESTESGLLILFTIMESSGKD